MCFWLLNEVTTLGWLQQGEGHRHDHRGLDDQGDSPKRQQNRLKTLPSTGDPTVADDQRPPPPPADRSPGGHNRDAGDGADDDKLARFA